jgi:hypothetical protein
VSLNAIYSQSRYQTKVSGQPYAPTALTTGNRRLRGLQIRPGHFAEEKNYLAPCENRTPDRPALYRVRDPVTLRSYLPFILWSPMLRQRVCFRTVAKYLHVGGVACIIKIQFISILKMVEVFPSETLSLISHTTARCKYPQCHSVYIQSSGELRGIQPVN